MSQYVQITDVKMLGSMPSEDIDQLETLYPGITNATATAVSGLFDSKLAKRYGAPFTAPYPDAIVFNVAREVAWRLWLKRGYNPSGQLDQSLEKDHLEAIAWLDEAANSQTGLVELPSKQDVLGASGAVNRGGPLAYHESSPWTWTDLQRTAGRTEDSSS